MDSEIMVEPLPMLGVCTLCLTEGAVKSMLIAQKHKNSTEYYSEMLLKCFSIDIAILDLGDMKRLICDTCIIKLRDAAVFRQQVENSLETLEATAKLHKIHQPCLSHADGVFKEACDYEMDEEKPDLKDDFFENDVVGGLVSDDERMEKRRRKVKPRAKQRNAVKRVPRGRRAKEVSPLSQLDRGNEIQCCLKQDIKFIVNDVVKDSTEFEKDDEGTDLPKTYINILNSENNCAEDMHNTDTTQHTDRISQCLKQENPGGVDITEMYGDGLLDGDGAIKSEIDSDTEHSYTKTRRKTSRIVLKKKASLQETETMLSRGLFPFKLRKNKLFSCSICPEESPNLHDIKTHILDHNKTNIHLALKKMILSNSQRFYKSGTNLRCKICTVDIRDYNELAAHIDNCTRLKSNTNWNTLPFKLEKDQLDCPVCKKRFLNYVSLNTHMNVHYPNHICENCGKAFASRARLRGHMRTHEVGHFPCKYCPAVFDIVTKRENHVSKDHKAGVRYACKRCNISLNSFYARQKHLAEVHNEELKKYKCNACSQCYITPGHLSSHVRRDHLNERNHRCDRCDLAFYTRNALKMHMIKHNGERIHACNICQKSYQRKKTLREHMRIHANDKRFVCPVCGRAFTQKCTLKGHLKVHEPK